MNWSFIKNRDHLRWKGSLNKYNNIVEYLAGGKNYPEIFQNFTKNQSIN